MKASRKRRIAAGAGVPVQEVNRLLSPVRADAGHDEADEKRRHGQDDARHGRHEGPGPLWRHALAVNCQ
ncbi:hypothetical protein [Bordetella pertussis]|uniref:hypothetical protein n=1 Tax=Bordetella pertussis TaxID=520 RepID=UPI00240628E0|nr:hypothetical protein [Bordetella pertussis]